MIHTNRVVTVGDQESIIDKPIILYRGDREVEVEFELIGNEFMFSTDGNVIKSVNASHGQLVLNTPSGDNSFSELAECHDGKVVFVITKEMIDEFIEVGFYSFQIRLYDGEQMKSRVTIPPVFSGIDIRNPIAAEDETNVVGMAVVDYARIYRDQSNEELPTFDWTGNYNKTDWMHHDIITENKMNKIEDGLWTINNKISESDNVFLKKAEQMEVQRQNDVNKLNSKDTQLTNDIQNVNRTLTNELNKLKVDVEVGDIVWKNETEERLVKIEDELNDKTTEINTMVELKRYNATLGEKIRTYGYHSIDDGGGGKYVVVDSGVDDGGSCISLNNGLYAKLIHDGVIYARQFGAKLDDSSDDTEALNRFFAMCENAKLIVDNGIAVISDTLFIKGRWREDSATKYNNSIRQIEFVNASVRYIGEKGKCCMMFYNHFNSLIEGLAVCRTSNDCYIDMTMVWHTEFRNFDVPQICMNKNPNSVTSEVKSVHTNTFYRGHIFKSGVYMDSSVEYINSIHFTEVNFFNRNYDYCCEFVGPWFQNVTFTKCDMSYANKALFKINDKGTNNSSIAMYSCYLDSSIPYMENDDLKNFRLTAIDNFEAARGLSRAMCKTEDLMRNYSLSGYTTGSDNIPMMCMNVAKNGNLANTNTNDGSGWITNSSDISYSFVSTTANTSGNALRCTFVNNSKPIIYFSSIPLPVTSVYTFGLRVKKVSGTGKVQISIGGVYLQYDFSTIPDGTDMILSTNTRKEKTFEMGSILHPILNGFDGSNINNLILDILEIIVLPGSVLMINTPLHPDASFDEVVIPKNSLIEVTYPTNINADTVMNEHNNGVYTAYGFNHQGTVPSAAISILGMKSQYDSGSFQIAFSAYASGMYFRTTSNGAYNAWERVLTNKYTLTCNSNGRPTDVVKGVCYFDNTLNKPIWWDGTKWIDATGASV